jgi:hypothetical protein
MSRNQVQFQKGMSLAEFLRLYGTEELCHAALVKMRWPDGFVCPRCGGREHSYYAARRLFQCSACRVQTSVKAGTIFHGSRTPLTKWFLAMHLITSAKNDVAALELSRQIGVKWDTAWLIKQKLLAVMLERNATYQLAGDVQVDDAYLGGERPGEPGKRGRGARGKTPFVIAVETHHGEAQYTQLRRVPGFTKAAIKAWAEKGIAPGSRVLSDKLSCFNGIDEAGFEHVGVVTGSRRPTDARFKWVNTGLGNVKSAIVGTCRWCSAQHAARYLAGYEWRFNRRFDLAENIGRLARVAAATAPHPRKQIAAIRKRPAELTG